ncbi:MAG: NAD(P)/FAD-dependent oxidoreductase [Methanomassiliicoccaceae archaeon]|nr:NAD(P)/FAD-dependent oxidoreductase [Methanomassiliicoccaceae archaeon]MCL2143770.1 NAD(P)/FAD-dependent oxidoreductase [Methanomassiliicoccaceae archaeon]
MDVIIIGVGPAGLQAAIHAARGKASTTMIGKTEDSAMHGAHVENYFGIEGRTDGSDILKRGLTQAASFGAEHIRENVTAMERSGDSFIATTENDTRIEAKAVILASGISRKKLNVPGEKEYFGKGVSYCAACDCNFYKGKRVAVIGDDSEAAASAELMTSYASHVFWITKDTKASDIMIRKAKDAGAEIISEEVKEIMGKEKVTKIMFSDSSMINVEGVFIELGARSSSDLAMDIDVMPNTDGTISVNERCETPVKGVYACGDVTGRPWQIAKAVGQGAVAGMNAAAYIKGDRVV